MNNGGIKWQYTNISDSKLLTTLILRHIILLTRSKIVIKVSTHDTNY